MNDIAIVSILENHFCHVRKTSMRKVFYFDSLTILIRQAKCATSEKLAFVNDTVGYGIQYFAIQRIECYLFYCGVLFIYRRQSELNLN